MEKVKISDSGSEFRLKFDKQVLIDPPKIGQTEVEKPQTLKVKLKFYENGFSSLLQRKNG